MRIAVIDLGTNTFNLTVSDVADNKVMQLIEQKEPVKIGEGSLKNNRLQETPKKRGFCTLSLYKSIIEKYEPNKVFGFATSAIRSTDNGREYIDHINKKLSLNIEIIDGNKEAYFIYQGVKNCINWKKNALILDIGGGSNEVIIGNNKEAYFLHSYNLGVARLKQNFVLDDPLTESQKQILFNHFDDTTQNLQTAIANHQPVTLIGSSGTFDTLHKILEAQAETLNTNDFKILIDRILSLNLAQKRQLKGMPEFRAEFIHIGVLFIQFLLTKFSPQEIIYSEYSLKEGVIFDQIKTMYNE